MLLGLYTHLTEHSENLVKPSGTINLVICCTAMANLYRGTPAIPLLQPYRTNNLFNIMRFLGILFVKIWIKIYRWCFNMENPGSALTVLFYYQSAFLLNM